MSEKKVPYHRPYTLSKKEQIFLGEMIQQIVRSGQLTNGEWVEILENRIKDLYNVDYVLTTSSCTMGLFLCLLYLNPSYIQVPMFNWWSDLYILKALKQDIAWNDVDMKTWLPIEQYGGASLYLNTFGNIGKSKRENAIYDSSHCLGAKIEDIGLAHVFSLAPTKLITSCEGGLIMTNNKGLYDYAIELRNKCARMSEIHALIGLTTFQHLDEILKWKERVYNYYKKYIPGQFQEIPNNSNYNTIGFLNNKRLKIPKHIEYRRYYEPIWDNGIRNNSKKIHRNIICLPSWYSVNYKQIVEDILEFNKK